MNDSRCSIRGILNKDALRNDIEKRFGGVENKDYTLCIAHTNYEQGALAMKEELSKAYPGQDIYVDHLSLSVACHTGPGALGIGCCRKLHYDEV